MALLPAADSWNAGRAMESLLPALHLPACESKRKCCSPETFRKHPHPVAQLDICVSLDSSLHSGLGGLKEKERGREWRKGTINAGRMLFCGQQRRVFLARICFCSSEFCVFMWSPVVGFLCQTPALIKSPGNTSLHSNYMTHPLKWIIFLHFPSLPGSQTTLYLSKSKYYTPKVHHEWPCFSATAGCACIFDKLRWKEIT